MTANEAAEILKKAGVPDYYYRIRRPFSTECTVLEKRGPEWITFIWERGQEGLVEHFPDENSAANSFVASVMKTFEMSKKKSINTNNNKSKSLYNF